MSSTQRARGTNRGGKVLRTTPRTASIPGVDLVYDTFVDKIASQRHDLDQIDVKLGVLAAILATAAGGALAIRGPAGTSLALLLVVPIAIAAFGLRVQKGRNDPNPMTMIRFAGDDPSFIKELTLRSLMKTFETNQTDLEEKAWHLNRTVQAASAVLVLAIVGKAAGIA